MFKKTNLFIFAQERNGPGSPSSPAKTPTSVSSKPEKLATTSRPPSTTPSNKSTKSRSTSRNRLLLKTPEPEPVKKGKFHFEFVVFYSALQKILLQNSLFFKLFFNQVIYRKSQEHFQNLFQKKLILKLGLSEPLQIL